jgi:hypothetical protein
MVTGLASGELYCGGARRPKSKSSYTNYYKMRKRMLEMRRITLITKRRSMMPEMVGDERIIQNSDELLEKGTARLTSFRASPDSSLLLDYQ